MKDIQAIKLNPVSHSLLQSDSSAPNRTKKRRDTNTGLTIEQSPPKPEQEQPLEYSLDQPTEQQPPPPPQPQPPQPKQAPIIEMARSKTLSTSQQQTNGDSGHNGRMIVERVNQIPVVNMAVSVGYSQYDKLKASNVTVGDVMSNAEKWASYLWGSVQPVVDKLQDPIDKADKLACKTLDYVEANVPAIKKSPQELISDSKSKYTQVVEQSTIMKIIRSIADILYGTIIKASATAQNACQGSSQQQPQQQHSAEARHS